MHQKLPVPVVLSCDTCFRCLDSSCFLKLLLRKEPCNDSLSRLHARIFLSRRGLPGCGFSPKNIAGFRCWAPELAPEGSGFKSEYFDRLAKLEAKNFWFRSRNSLIVWALKEYFPNFQSFLEVGCGTGFVLAGIAKAFPSVETVGSEIFVQGLPFAAARAPTGKFIQMDGRRIPYEDEFDVIGAFDVLEHIPEDDAVLAGMHRAVKLGGGILVTVPQHPSLWSATDEYACHVRRYSAVDLHSKIRNAGFEIILSTSFVTLSLPL